MTETVTLESNEGREMGKADLIASPEHFPEEIMVTVDHPQVFHLHHVHNGHLFYRPHYVPSAQNFRK